MSRLQLFYEYLASENLRPKYDSDSSFSFEFERTAIFVDINENDDFVLFSTHLAISYFDDKDVIASALNEVVRYNRYLTGWFHSETVFLAIGVFCSGPPQLGPYLFEVLYSLTAVSEDLEICAYDSPFFFDRIVNDGYAKRSTEMEKGVTAVAEDTRLDGESREALLMHPSSETANKLRWEVDIDGTSFSLYIPKLRVPLPWPKQIVVAVSSSELDTGGALGGTAREAEIDPRLPIIVVLQREARRKHTVRYRPLGNANTWEVGMPYIPYSLLPQHPPERVQLEVRWDFSAGSWST